MALYDVYIDESGTNPGDPVLVVGGYLIEQQRALRMDIEWRLYLAEKRLKWWHSANCIPWPPSDVCKHLSCAECEQIERYLIKLIGQRTLMGFATFANPKSVTQENSLDLYGRCLALTVTSLLEVVKNFDPLGKVAFFIEDGHDTSAKAIEFLQQQKKASPDPHLWDGGIALKSKEQTPLLQAADLLVWQSRKYMADRISGIRKPRKDFRALVTERHGFGYTFFDQYGWTIHRGMSPLEPDKARDDLIGISFGLAPPPLMLGSPRPNRPR
jgi:hypothetical protein